MSSPKKIIVYLLLVFLFQEVVFRIGFPIPELSNFDRSSFVLKIGQAGSFVRNKSFNWWSLPDTVDPCRLDYNMYGFRGNEWVIKKRIGKKRILFVGDSFVEGIMAPQDQTIPNWFKAANLGPEIEVMNAGMLGTGMTQYLQFIADAVPIFKPDVVFLVVYANDFTSSDIEIPALNLKESYFDSSQPRALELLNQHRKSNPIPFRFSFQSNNLLPSANEPKFPFKDKLDEMYIHADSFLVENMLSAKFNPFKLNEMFRVERALREPANFLVPIDFFRYYSEKYGFEPIVVYIPSRNQVTHYYLQFDYRSSLKFNRNISFTEPQYNGNQQQLGEICKTLGVKYYDLTSRIEEEESVGNHLYWNYDDHMRAKGYGIVGESIYREWSSQP
jgi:lysophospholipase L1-like esterase